VGISWRFLDKRRTDSKNTCVLQYPQSLKKDFFGILGTKGTVAEKTADFLNHFRTKREALPKIPIPWIKRNQNWIFKTSPWILGDFLKLNLVLCKMT
jgi:hypothetical protein